MKMKAMMAVAAALAVSPVFATPYVIDDGVTENSIGINSTGMVSMFWGNNFIAKAGGEVITHVEASFGSPLDPNVAVLNGASFVAFVMRANANGTPMQGGLLATGAGVIASAGTDTFITVDTPDVVLNVGDNFMVGIVHDKPAGAPGQFPAGFDQTAPLPQRSYAAFTVDAGSIDPNNINAVPAANQNYIETFGLTGNWTVRAQATAVPEPATFVALGLGLAGLALARRRK